jgi:hypothetical protein
MAAHGEIRWPPLGRFNGRLWGGSHGRRHTPTLTLIRMCNPLCEDRNLAAQPIAQQIDHLSRYDNCTHHGGPR